MIRMKKLKHIKPYHTFETRSGVKPHFDKGDVVTDGEKMLVILNINSASDGKVYYSVINGPFGLHPDNEYFCFNEKHTLIKKGDLKTKYALSNDCHLPIEGVYSSEDIIQMALGNKPWHDFFEKAWTKEWKGEEPQDISWRGY